MAFPVNPSDINTIQSYVTLRHGNKIEHKQDTFVCHISDTYVLGIEFQNSDVLLFITGVYPIKPTLPAVGGGEGVGVVLETGKNVTSMTKGDWVIPAGPGLGMSTSSASSACSISCMRRM